MEVDREELKNKTYDVLILGGGPAGLTAAIYCGRYNLNTLVVSSNFGGTANLAGEVENWPGVIASGKEIMDKIKEQAEKFGAKFLQSEVNSVGIRKEEKGEREFVLTCDHGFVKSKALIVCLGTEHRQLNIPGEKEFLGKGVSYCATCDGNFFREKSVAVVGGADSAAKAALYLADICKKVTVIYRKHEMRCEPIALDKIKSNDKIEVMYHSSPVEIFGEGVVKGVKVKRSEFDHKADCVVREWEEELAVDGVFIEAGSVPVTKIIEGIDVKMNNGYIVTGKDCSTNVDGLFAAGDATDVAMRQMIVAAGEGAVAAKSAHEFLLRKN